MTLDQWLHVRLPPGMLDTFRDYAGEHGARGVSTVVRQYLETCAGLTPEELDDLVALGQLCLTAAEATWERLPDAEKEVLRAACAGRAWTAARLHLLPAYLETLPLEALSIGTRKAISKMDRGTLWGLRAWAAMHPPPVLLDAGQPPTLHCTRAANGVSCPGVGDSCPGPVGEG